MHIKFKCPKCGETHIIDTDSVMAEAKSEEERLSGSDGDGELLIVSGFVSRATRVKSE